MTVSSAKDWDPGTYARFRGLRFRPAIDLLAQVPALAPGPVVDLGCGTGTVGPALRARFGGKPLVGVDSSPAMLDEARTTGAYDHLDRADIATWEPVRPAALVYSNATLQWLQDHERLFPRLAGLLAPGGVLAVQMPDQQDAPSHALLREISAAMFPDLFDWADWRPPVASPYDYARWLGDAGAPELWHTVYYQRLERSDEGHPIRRFTQSTALRPVAERLSEAELQAFLARYDRALETAYPVASDGKTWFPFRRFFLVLTT